MKSSKSLFCSLCGENNKEKLFNDIYFHISHINMIISERMRDTHLILQSQDYLAVSLFKNFFSSLEMLSKMSISEEPSQYLQHVGKDMVDFQLRLGLKFSQSSSRSVTHSDDDDDDDDIERNGNFLHLSKPKNSSRAISPNTEVVSRNKVKKDFIDSTQQSSTNINNNTTTSTSTTSSSSITTTTSLPFTTYIPTPIKKSEKDIETQPIVLTEEEAKIIQYSRDGNLTLLSQLVELAVEKGTLKSLSNIESIRDTNYMNALDHASACGQVEVIRELILSYGIKVNSSDPKYGFTPLHHACRSGQMQAVTFLVLVASADINHKSIEGLTPYDVASSKRIRKMLIKNQSDISIDSNASTPNRNTSSSSSINNNNNKSNNKSNSNSNSNNDNNSPTIPTTTNNNNNNNHHQQQKQVNEKEKYYSEDFESPNKSLSSNNLSFSSEISPPRKVGSWKDRVQGALLRSTSSRGINGNNTINQFSYPSPPHELSKDDLNSISLIDDPKRSNSPFVSSSVSCHSIISGTSDSSEDKIITIQRDTSNDDSTQSINKNILQYVRDGNLSIISPVKRYSNRTPTNEFHIRESSDIFNTSSRSLRSDE